MPVVDVDALLATPLRHAWGKAQAPPAALAPLATLPPANAGIAVALGDWTAHAGRKWHVCGAVGGLMRKLGYSRAACEAEIRAWLPAGEPSVDVGAGVRWACAAWDKPSADVSGYEALAAVLGDEHATLVNAAAARKRDPFHAPDLDADVFAPLALDTTRQGTPRPTHANVLRVLESVFGTRLYLDTFRGRVLCSGADVHPHTFEPSIWTDRHTTVATCVCEEMQLFVKPAAVDRAVLAHAWNHRRNPVEEWLAAAAAAWDGTPRVDDALAVYWGAPDDAATRAVARVFLLSLAARGLVPGTKVDTCPIFIGLQGTLKSTSFSVLVGGVDHFADSPLPIGDKDALQMIRGKWLWEFQEGASTSKKAVDDVKAFLSARSDTFRASYGRHTEDVPRTACFVMSVNSEADVLRDPTGARRFLPVRVTRADVAGLARDREQLLGEATVRVLNGEQHWPTDAETAALAPIRDALSEHDTWTEALDAWTSKRRGDFSLGDVFEEISGAVPMMRANVTRSHMMRAANALSGLGYVRVRVVDARGVRAWRWRRATP